MVAAPWVIAVFALALRLVVIALTGGPSGPEVFEYEDLARHLLSGHGLTTTHLGATYRSLHSAVPYVGLNAVVCGLTNHRHVFLLLVQSLVTSLLVIIVFRIAHMIFDARVATLAALLTAVHPGLVVYDTRKLHSLSLDAFFIAAAGLLVMSLGPEASVGRRLATGVVLALGMYERGSLVVFAAVSPLWAGWALRPTRARAARFAIPVFVGVVLTFGPWVARNYVIHHTVVVMTTSGEHFWRGNHPGATGTAYAVDGRDILTAAADDCLKSRLADADELGQMRAFADAARDFWRVTPGEGLVLYAKKVFYFFTVTPTAGLLYPEWEYHVYLAYYLVCALAAVIGVRALVRLASRLADSWPGRRWQPLFCLISVALVQSLFYIETRHRWGVEPLLLVFTAKGLCDIIAFRGSTSPPACSEDSSRACSPTAS